MSYIDLPIYLSQMNGPWGRGAQQDFLAPQTHYHEDRA
jgi:hypothetical protein